MARRGFAFITALTLLAPTLALRAQDSAQPEVENSKYQITGIINSNAVFIRSGPSENDYATTKLDKGATVTVVGERFNWLKIVPPEGSFCVVGKAWVNRAGDGTIGQVTTSLNVRVGSDLNNLKTKVAGKLEPGQKVEIIGEQDEYFKIKPPAGTCFYINKQFVDPVAHAETAAVPTDTPTAPTTPTSPTDSPKAPETATNTQPGMTDVPTAPFADAGPTTAPSKTVAQGSSDAPATQPSAALDDEFERLETTYAKVTQQPLEDQPVDELLSGYKALASADALPESMRRICDFKVGVLTNRAQLKSNLAGTRQLQEDMKQKQAALKGEQKELEDLVKKTQVDVYVAVGTLRTSSLQVGQQVLYRLTDPANSRIVVYIRSDDAKLSQAVGQFIGVSGDVQTDPQLGLKIVTPTSFKVVDPSKVGTSVVAQFVPPSLLPGKTGTVSAD